VYLKPDSTSGKATVSDSHTLLANLQDLIAQINQSKGLKDSNIKISFTNKNDIVVNIGGAG
jgi:hypothetical protein